MCECQRVETVSPFLSLKADGAALIAISLALSRTPAEATRPRIQGTVNRVVCPFTPQLSLVLNNWPRRDGTLSWHWYTAGFEFEPKSSRSQVRHRATRPLCTMLDHQSIVFETVGVKYLASGFQALLHLCVIWDRPPETSHCPCCVIMRNIWYLCCSSNFIVWKFWLTSPKWDHQSIIVSYWGTILTSTDNVLINKLARDNIILFPNDFSKSKAIIPSILDNKENNLTTLC